MKYNHRMPKISKLFFAAALCSSITSLGQATVCVAPVKMNVLYIGVDNPVSIAASSTPDEKLTVSIEGGGGSISKIHDGLYNVRVGFQTDNCFVNIYIDGKLAGTSNFRVRMLPQPFATVGGFKSGMELTAGNLLKQPGVGVGIENFPFEINYQVLRFTVSLTDNKGNLITTNCEGSSFSAQAKQYLNDYAKPGQIVTIENIKVKQQDGSEIHLPSLLYTIK